MAKAMDLGRSAMTAVIDAEDGPSGRRQPPGQPPIAAEMLSQAVGDLDHERYAAIAAPSPALRVKRVISCAMASFFGWGCAYDGCRSAVT
jgi:hypothetical protein